MAVARQAKPLQYALWRCVSALMPGAQQGAVAVVEFGSQGTDVVIAKDGQVRLSRHLSLGTDSVAEAMVGVVATDRGDVSIDRPKAEAIQRRYGIFVEGAEGATEDGVPFFHLASLMRPVLEKLLTELSRVLDFYKVQMDEAGVSRLLLCGAGATLKQLPAYVGEGLGMPADIFNPLLHIPGGTASLTPEALADRGPRLVATIGAALDRGHELDLMSGGTRQLAAGRQAWSRLAAGGVAAVAVGAVLLGLAALLLQWQVQGQEQVWRHLEGPYAESRQVADK